MKINTKFNFGDKVREKITGYEGIIIACDFWQTGCFRYCVKPQMLKDGLPQDGHWIDEMNLEIIKEKPIKSVKSGPAGPRETNQNYYPKK